MANTIGVRPLPDRPAIGAGHPGPGSTVDVLMADTPVPSVADGSAADDAARPRLVGIDGMPRGHHAGGGSDERRRDERTGRAADANGVGHRRGGSD